MGEDRDRARGEPDDHNRQQGDRAQVGSQVAERGEVRRVEEQRRQYEDQHEVGLEGDIRHPWNGAQSDAPDNQDDRVRHADSSGDCTERCDRREDPELREFHVLHR